MARTIERMNVNLRLLGAVQEEGEEGSYTRMMQKE